MLFEDVPFFVVFLACVFVFGDEDGDEQDEDTAECSPEEDSEEGDGDDGDDEQDIDREESYTSCKLGNSTIETVDFGVLGTTSTLGISPALAPLLCPDGLANIRLVIDAEDRTRGSDACSE